MAQTRKSTKKTSTKQKASSTKKKKTSASKAATTSSSSKSSTSKRASKTATRKASPKASPPTSSKTTSKANSKATAKTSKATSAKKTSTRKKTTTRRATAATRKASAAKDLPQLDLVCGLADVVQDYGLEELIYDSPDVTITLRRPRPGLADMAAVAAPMANAAAHPVNVPAMSAPPMLIASPPPAPPPDPDKFLERSGAESDEEHQVIKSPFVGTFYRRPSPDADPYVTLGMRVSKGQVMCIIEAMKLMNEIECDISGRIADILVEDGQPVEYGQPLFKITYS